MAVTGRKLSDVAGGAHIDLMLRIRESVVDSDSGWLTVSRGKVHVAEQPLHVDGAIIIQIPTTGDVETMLADLNERGARAYVAASTG